MKTVKSWQKIDMEYLTGIKERRVCAKNEDSYTLARDAAKECLRNSKYKPEDIELIVCCSISKYKDGLDYVYEPTFSVLLKEDLGLKNALNFDVNNACAGMLTGVLIVDDFIKRGAIKCGMVVSGEHITSLSKNAANKVKLITSKQLASLTVGDGGGAVILERSSKGQARLSVSHFVTLSQYCKLCLGSPAKDAPGACMTTEAREIHKVAIRDSPPILEKAVNASGIAFGDLDHIIPHQTSIRAIKSGGKMLARHFGVTPKDIVFTLDRFANTASTTHFIALYTLLNEKKLKKGENIMLICYASGLVVGIVIFTMDELVDKYGSGN